MNKHLATYFREQRLRKGLSLHSLALTVAPDNSRKTAGRIGRFEAEGVIGEELLAAVADALSVDFPIVEELMERDRRESFIRGDLPHPAEPRTNCLSWTIKRLNPTAPTA
jgi:hypothetical protein